jgi:hypothetical protein
MNKKVYKAPSVKKVRLVVKNSVLASCHQSPNLDAKSDAIPCVTTGCLTPG